MALLGADGKPIIKDIQLQPGHFATAVKVGDFIDLLNILPDPDPVLKKKNIEIKALRELLVDSYLEANITVRISSVSGADYDIVPQADDPLSRKAHEFIVENIQNLNVPRINEEMMWHPFFGFSPHEIIPVNDGKYWVIADIVGKPPEWFAFDKDNHLVLKNGWIDYTPLPPLKFVILQHRASYNNPYGEKILSKCYWPVVFKRTGFTWWTSFVEKYGGALMFGTYPLANEKVKDKLLEALASMISDSVASIPQGCEVEIHEATGKANSSTVYKEYTEAADRQIAWAVNGQNLTTQSSPNGNQATATIHNEVRGDINEGDKRRVAGAWNQIISWYTYYNFEGAIPSKYEFRKKEEIKKDIAERDSKIYAMGYEFSPEYLERVHNFKKGEIIKREIIQQPQISNFKAGKKHISLFDRFKSFFADKPKITKEDKQELNNFKIMDEYAKQHSADFQNAVDDIIDSLFEEIQKARDYNEVFQLVVEKYPQLDFDKTVDVIEKIRFCASQIGAFEKAKKKSSHGKNT